MSAGSEQESIIMYWRPGCGFCTSLAAGLQRAGIPFTTVNIWEVPEAAAFVRSVANGNEIVPTVRIGSRTLVNPSPREVLSVAQVEAPALVADISL